MFQNETVSIPKKHAHNSVNDVRSFCGRVAVADAREVRLLFGTSAVLIQVEGGTAGLRQARDTIYRQSEE